MKVIAAPHVPQLEPHGKGAVLFVNTNVVQWVDHAVTSQQVAVCGCNAVM